MARLGAATGSATVCEISLRIACPRGATPGAFPGLTTTRASGERQSRRGLRPPRAEQFDVGSRSISRFELVSPYGLAGDQPRATVSLAAGIERGDRAQTLLGVTGSGKTMAMARVVELVQKPTLVLCHNKTLAAQLCAEFRDFFPNNAVEYFVSYFDYYQPEAYIAHTDTYIAKDSSINDEIERLRHSATQSLLTRPRHADRGVGLVHFRVGLARGLHGAGGRHQSRRQRRPRRISCASCRACNIGATTSIWCAARFACGAIRSNSWASTKSSSIASSSSATRSKRSTSSTY